MARGQRKRRPSRSRRRRVGDGYAFVDVLWQIDGLPAAVASTLPKGLSLLPKHLCAPHYCCSSSCLHSPFSIICCASSNFSFFVLVETCFVSFSNAPRHHSIERSNKFTKRRVGNLYPLKTIISIATAYTLILKFSLHLTRLTLYAT